MTRSRRRGRHIACAAVMVVVLTLVLMDEAPALGPPVIAAAGDIACDPTDANFNGGKGTAKKCHMGATALLLDGLFNGAAETAVLPLGDTQYTRASSSEFAISYAPTWGRFKAASRPTPGNHDYRTSGAAGYFGYFGANAGDPARGYYSWDVGDWHLISLNSNCAQVGGCGAGSPQERWLRADLAAHPVACTLAYWHHARYSSGVNGQNLAVAPLFDALYDGGADVALVAHSHHYERFSPQDAEANPDAVAGVRQFVVGTGGKSLEKFVAVADNSEVRVKAFGVLLLELGDGGYRWEFRAEAGNDVSDQGSGECHL